MIAFAEPSKDDTGDEVWEFLYEFAKKQTVQIVKYKGWGSMLHPKHQGVGRKMIITNKIGFFIDYSYTKQIENFFREYDIEVFSPEKGARSSEIRYLIPIPFGPEENTIEKMEEIRLRLLHLFPIDEIGEEILFSYNDDEYEKAPFLNLYSTGNSTQANLVNKHSVLKSNIFCEACGLKTKTLESSLILDTSNFKNRYMINIEGMFWVVSEKMAELMEKWNISGFHFEKVIHKGKPENSLPAYQLVVENTLLPLSSDMKYYYFVSEPKERCYVCDVKGKINYPYLFDKTITKTHTDDLYLLSEWVSNGSSVYHPLFISQRFRKLLLEHGVTRDVRSIYDNNYGSKDWYMTPVFLDHY